MVLVQTQVGPAISGEGSTPTLRSDRTGAAVTTDAHGRYQEAVLRGNVWYLSASSVAPAAFTGGAAGQPLLGVMNPAGSNKALVFLIASATLTVVQSAAGSEAAEIWAGVSALPTGTVTPPTNAASQQSTGSVAKGFVNVVMTGSTALNFIMGISSFWWATAAAGAVASGGVTDLAGIVVATPGVLVALGVRLALASATLDAFLSWEEVPYP